MKLKTGYIHNALITKDIHKHYYKFTGLGSFLSRDFSVFLQPRMSDCLRFLDVIAGQK